MPYEDKNINIEFYSLPLEKQREEFEKKYRSRTQELIKKASKTKGGIRVSAMEIEEARYVLAVLGIAWEKIDKLDVEETKTEIGRRTEKRNRIFEELEEKNPTLGLHENISKAYKFWGKTEEEKKEEISRLEKGLEEENKKKIKDEEKIKKIEDKLSFFREVKKDDFNKNFTEVKKLEDELEKLRNKKEDLFIQACKNMNLTERERHILDYAGRMDLAYGDSPRRLMERVREAGLRGEDVTRWHAATWTNKYAVMAMTFPHLLSLGRFSLEASWAVRDTATENPEFFAPGVTWDEKKWGKPFIKEKSELYGEPGSEHPTIPTWANIPGLVNKIVVSALEVDPVRHLEDLYKNARFEDRERLAKVIRDCLLKKMRASDMLGLDVGCVEMKVSEKYKETYQFDDVNGDLKNKKTGKRYIYDPVEKHFKDKETGEVWTEKTLEQIVDTNCAFWLITRYALPNHVGSPDNPESLFNAGKPEIIKGFTALKNYFIDKGTREEVEELDIYIREEAKPTDELRITRRYLEMPFLETEEQRDHYEKNYLDPKLGEVYGQETIKKWDFERKILERSILDTGLPRKEAIRQLASEVSQENKAAEILKRLSNIRGKKRDYFENYFSKKKVERIFNTSIKNLHFNQLILAYYAEINKINSKNKNEIEIIQKILNQK